MVFQFKKIFRNFPKAVKILKFICLIIFMSGCASLPLQELKLMPTPEIQLAGALEFDKNRQEDVYDGILYVTNRERDERKISNSFYRNKRGGRVRAGLGNVTFSPKKNEEVSFRDFSFSKNRSEEYPLRVSSVEEYGVISGIRPYGFLHADNELDNEKIADDEFTDAINRKLAVSSRKNIYIYVHGFKVVFERPLLVASELWHLMGYDGVFIAYSWPATPKRLAYFKDVETAHLSGHSLRLLLEYLSENTDAESINVVGFSAGTRVVTTAMHELALKHHDKSKEEIQRHLRIDQVVLIGSDYDPQRFAAAVAAGILNVPKNMSIYISETDAALGASRFVLGRSRLGQMVRSEKLPDEIQEWIENSKDLQFIDASAAEKSNAGNGHAYFRHSPWVSSDLLINLLYNLSPEKRGLIRKEGEVVWSFPKDYVERLKSSVDGVTTFSQGAR